ncbi:MAG TPA: Phenylacetic acid catabolic protein [Candidatus Eisenbacteria bacterium]|nr:Phenylacetic acid catabolic protein [Candidatus Eisenbacteria bacterium]
MFRDKVGPKEVEKLDPEYGELLRRVLVIQADCEIGGPHLYVTDILPNAPTKADQLLVARTAAEEMDHYRKFARIAGELGSDVSYVLSWPNQKRYLEAFRGRITTWEDFAIFGFLIDRVGRYQLEEFIDCTYRPLAEALPQILKEEIGHIGYGASKAAELAARGDAHKERLQRALNYWYPKALDMFGRSDSKRSERYRYWGLKRRSNEQARQEYIREVEPLIAKLGLAVPDVSENRTIR